MTNPEFRPVARQNPPVLLSPEMVCSARKHPFSSVSGRRRYNTLDFAPQNRVPTGRFRPYWKPGIKGICHPFEISARFEICIYKPEKRCLHLHIPKRKNPHNRSSDKERKDCGDFLCRIHCFENDMQHFPDDAYISRRGFSGTDSSFRRHMRYMYRSEDCRRLHRWPRPSFLFRG